MYLSPRVTKGWRQKEMNPFVSETAGSVCIVSEIIIIIDIVVYNKSPSVNIGVKNSQRSSNNNQNKDW